MKIITMYELLGMVKDGKAPKKIKYEDDIYELTSNKNDYYNESNNYWFTCQICSLGALNDEVEILEEEKKIPEKLIPTSLKGIDNLDEKIEIAHIDTISVIETVNQLIDYLKSKGE